MPELKYFIKILSPFFLIIQTEPISIGLDVMQVNLFAYEIMQEKTTTTINNIQTSEELSYKINNL